MSRKRKIFLYAAGWLLIISCVTLNTFLAHNFAGHGTPGWKALVRALAFCSFWILSVPILWLLSKRFPFHRDKWKSALAIHSTIAATIAVLIVPFRMALDLIPGVGILSGDALFRYYAATLPARSVILYGVSLAASQAFLFYQESLRQAELAAELRDKVARLVEDPATKSGHFAESFTLRESGRLFGVPVKQIDWIEAAGNYVSLHVNGRTHLLRETMNAIESKLDPRRFVRVNRSAIIQLDRVQELRTIGAGRLSVVLRPGAELVWGRGGKQKLESLAPHLRLVPAAAKSARS